jgi:hypothetical protein
MTHRLGLLCIQALLPGLVMVAVPAGIVAQSRMGNPGMARPPGSAAMGSPSRVGAMSPNASMMTPARQPMSVGAGGSAAPAPGSYGTGYGMGSYDDMRAYGASSGSANPQVNAAASEPSPETKSMRRLLTASGVPNDKGQVRWPIGLAILAAPGADDLVEQIEALFEEAALQAVSGPVNPALAAEARQAVKDLRRLLLKEKTERFGMPLAVYQESERFLDKLDRAAQVLRASMETPGGQRPSRTEGSSTSNSTGSQK